MLDIVVLGKKERERGKPVSYLLGPGWVTRCFSQKPWKGPSLVCHYKQSVLLILKSLTQFPPSYATLSSPGWHVLVFIFHSVRLSVSFNPVSLLCKVRFAAPSLPTPLPKTTVLVRQLLHKTAPFGFYAPSSIAPSNLGRVQCLAVMFPAYGTMLGCPTLCQDLLTVFLVHSLLITPCEHAT